MKFYTGEQWQPPQITELIPDIGPISYAPGRQFKTQLRSRLEGEQPKMLWLTDSTPEAGYATIEGSSFENNPAWQEGRRDSLQHVFFGTIALGSEIEAPIAVKPYPTSPNSGLHEASMLLHLESKGLRVYRLLGMSWSPNQGFAMITSFEEESRSLDNVDWSKDMSKPLGSHLTNLEAIEQVGQSLGQIWALGAKHGDARIKNFVVNGGEVVLNDLTHTKIMVGEDGTVNNAELREGMFNDSAALVSSLYAKNFLRSATNLEWSSFFKNVIATANRAGLFRAGDSLKQYGVNMRRLSAEVIDAVAENHIENGAFRGRF